VSDAIIILGSPTDRPWAESIIEALDRFQVTSEMRVASAHKTPRYLLDLLAAYEAQDGARVYITVAGRSNALSGFVDAAVASPVIACPPAGESFGGMDVLSSLRMPSGVAPVVVLDPKNAALAAAKMLALGHPDRRAALEHAQQQERDRVTEADAGVRGQENGAVTDPYPLAPVPCERVLS
jgi:5-(carboxyamino)imidazole ribonucleotide mutase